MKSIRSVQKSAVVLAIVLVTASLSWGQGPPPPFAFLQPPFTQTRFGSNSSFIGGLAFAPDGDVWADDCMFDGGTLTRFDLQTTGTDGQHPIVSTTSGLTGCGLTNHPNGNLYSNTDLGVVEISNPTGNTTAPTLLRTIGAGGNALGITVDPQTSHLVYVGADCRFTPTCTIYDLDPSSSEATSSVIVSLNSSVAAFVDGIAFDPTGNFLFLATRSRNTNSGFVNFFALTILKRDGTLVQQVSVDTCGDGCVHEPDGLAFHAGSPLFVVTNNVDGTMTRFDFLNNDYTQAPTITTFASGASPGSGDLAQVGPDGCLYLTLDTSVSTGPGSVATVCGGFAQPPGSSQTVVLTYPPSGGSPETQIATIGQPTDPVAHSLALTLASVINTIN